MDKANALTSSATRFELQYSTEREELCNYLTALMSDLTAIEKEVDFFRSLFMQKYDLVTIAGFLDASFSAK